MSRRVTETHVSILQRAIGGPRTTDYAVKNTVIYVIV